MIRKLGFCIMTGVLVTGLASSAEAVQLNGSFSKTGTFEPFTCTAGVCVQQSNLDLANAIDITNVAGVPTPGVSGPILGQNATNDFIALGLNGATGQMQDFSFKGTGGAGFPLPPLATFEVFPGILTFQLTTVSVNVQQNGQLGLIGTGLFTGVAGFENTPGTFSFTAQGSTGSFSFSSTQTATPQSTVPEPGSMILLGTGLFSLASAARRRMTGR